MFFTVSRVRVFEKIVRGGLVASYYQALGTRSRAEGCRGWGGGLLWVGFLFSWRSARGLSWALFAPGAL